MGDHVGGNASVILRLCQNKRALDHGLRVQSKALRRPVRVWRVTLLGCSDHLGHGLRVRVDAREAGVRNDGA